MNTITTEKKAPKDWHRADILAALKKANWSLRKLSFHYGYKSNALANALDRPWPKAERIIAKAIGEKPETIWPSRYAYRNRKPVLGVKVS